MLWHLRFRRMVARKAAAKELRLVTTKNRVVNSNGVRRDGSSAAAQVLLETGCLCAARGGDGYRPVTEKNSATLHITIEMIAVQ
jgi:hypothetical protein